ncbi:MAG: hypothetical protein U0U09_17325 [Cyclobacteriaceae bacterium]
MKYTFSILILCLVMGSRAYGQEVLENNPPSVKFYKINTPHFKVLYPKDFEQEAQRVAATLEHAYQPESNTLQARPRKISVVLQNQSSISNGFVTLTPRRSEFYTMPSQDYNFLGTNDWLDQLVSHEYRHVVQYQRVNTGFNRLLYYAFGPATLAAMATTSMPQWAWEGDAVATETAFTHSGRGRIPNFGLLMRTNLQEGRVFNYNKQYLRSYKHNIPDHYVLGYHMISYLRKRTGDPDVWGKVMKRTANASFVPFRFSGSVKKIGGLTLPELYRATAEDLSQTYREQLSNVELTPFDVVSKRKSNTYTSYLYPQVLADGSIIAIKNGIGDFTQFVVFRNGREEKSFIPGVVNDAGMLSAAGNKVVWSEYGFDPRWRIKNYSLIKSYDIEKKQYTVLTHKTRYAGAAISTDGTKIVTVESTTDYKLSVVVIDSERGDVLKKFNNPENAFYSMARWSPDGKKIVALKTQNSLRSVVLIDYETEKETTLIKGSDENIGHPVLTGKYLLFNSPVSGIDNIYAFDLERDIRLAVTSAKYGAYNPVVSPDGKTLYYSNQTRDGFDIVSVSFDPAAWKRIETFSRPKEYYSYLSEQEGRPGLFDSIPNTTFSSSRYSKISGLFNPYSWGAYFNSSFTRADIGISSQDVLSTTVIKAGYLFDINERTGAWHAGVSYQGWYPIIDVDFKYASRSAHEGLITYRTETDTLTEKLDLTWKEATVEAGLRVPLIGTRSRYYTALSVGNYFGYTRVSEFENSIDGGGRLFPSSLPQFFLRDYLDNGTLLYNRFSFTASRLLKQSRRDINSRWGQLVVLDWYSTPYGGDFSADQFSAYGQLFFPGLFKHHSLWGYGGFQKTELAAVSVSTGEGLNSYVFNNRVPLPRGHSVSLFRNFYTASVNYTLPLWYPDAAIGAVLNIQRFRGNVFYDYGFGKGTSFKPNLTQSYASVGGELRMDFNAMRFLPQLNVGVRYAYGLKTSVTKFEILIGLVNF